METMTQVRKAGALDKALPIEKIEVRPGNPRRPDCERPEELEALAEDVRRRGVLQPIGVVDGGDGTHWLVWGSRRLAAAKSLGLKTIPALVFLPGEVDEDEAAAAENLHRRAMNPLEEVLAVETLMERYRGASPAAAQQSVGEAIGKSAQWVRDRLYLARLGTEARKLVVDGTMSLGVARQLAKVVDPRQQEDLIGRWYGKKTRFSDAPPSADEAAVEVNQIALSLYQVPWQLDAINVAPGCPACTGCPSNSAVARKADLFEHDDSDSLAEIGRSSLQVRGIYRSQDQKAFKAPACLDGRCFERKQAAASKAIAKATAAAKSATSKKPSARLDAALEAAPDWMEPDAIDHAAKSQEPKKAEPTRVHDEKAARARHTAMEVKRKARQKAEAALQEKRFAHLARTPGALIGLWVLRNIEAHDEHSPFGKARSQWDKKSRERAPLPRDLVPLLHSIAAGDLTLLQLDLMVAADFKPTHGKSVLDELRQELGTAARTALDAAFLTPDLLVPEKADAPATAAAVTKATAKKAATKKKPAKKASKA